MSERERERERERKEERDKIEFKENLNFYEENRELAFTFENFVEKDTRKEWKKQKNHDTEL